MDKELRSARRREPLRTLQYEERNQMEDWQRRANRSREAAKHDEPFYPLIQGDVISRPVENTSFNVSAKHLKHKPLSFRLPLQKDRGKFIVNLKLMDPRALATTRSARSVHIKYQEQRGYVCPSLDFVVPSSIRLVEGVRILYQLTGQDESPKDNGWIDFTPHQFKGPVTELYHRVARARRHLGRLPALTSIPNTRNLTEHSLVNRTLESLVQGTWSMRVILQGKVPLVRVASISATSPFREGVAHVAVPEDLYFGNYTRVWLKVTQDQILIAAIRERSDYAKVQVQDPPEDSFQVLPQTGTNERPLREIQQQVNKFVNWAAEREKTRLLADQKIQELMMKNARAETRWPEQEVEAKDSMRYHKHRRDWSNPNGPIDRWQEDDLKPETQPTSSNANGPINKWREDDLEPQPPPTSSNANARINKWQEGDLEPPSFSNATGPISRWREDDLELQIQPSKQQQRDTQRGKTTSSSRGMTTARWMS